MAIENRTLPAGTTLSATFKKQAHTCEVVESGDGLRFRLADGREFKSPSAAGSAVMGGVACNGWRFWSRADEATSIGIPASELPAVKKALKEMKAKAEGPAAEKPARTRKPVVTPPFKNLKKARSQSGAPEGEERWYCSSCQKAFFTPAGTPPEACPEGHGREMADELAPEGMPLPKED